MSRNLLISIWLGLITPMGVLHAEIVFPESDETHPLRILLASGVREADPHKEFTAYAETIFAGVYDRLVDFDEDGEVVPRLAVSWSQSDELTYRFELRRGVVFHDGSTFDSRDVVFSLERPARLPWSQIVTQLSLLKSVRAIGDHVVEVTLREADPLFLARLCFVAIVPSGSPDQISTPVGTGPYRWSSWDASGVELVAFGRSWSGVPKLSRVRFDFVPSSHERTRRLLEGRADLVDDLAPADADLLDQTDGCWVHSRIATGITYLGFDHASPWMRDPRIRQALDLGIDRRALVEDLYLHYARAAGQMAGPSTFGFDPELPPIERDLDKARRLLGEAAPRGLPTLSLLAADSRHELAEMLVLQLLDLGIEVEARLLPFTELTTSLEQGTFDLFLMGWGNNIADLADLYRHLVHSADGEAGHGLFNLSRIHDPSLDRAIEAALDATESEARLRLTLEASQQVRHQHLISPLFWKMSLYGAREGLDFMPRVDHRINPAQLRWLHRPARCGELPRVP